MRNFIISLDASEIDLLGKVIADGFWNSEPNTNEWRQVNTILSQNIGLISSGDNQVLCLFFGLDISQTDITKVTNYNQTTISRLISKVKKNLLVALGKELNIIELMH